MTTALSTPRGHLVSCSKCLCSIESAAKFCGECGEITELGSGVFQAIYEARSPEILPEPYSVAGAITNNVQLTNDINNEQIENQVSYHELALLESYRLAQRSQDEVAWAPTPTPTNNQGELIEHNNQSEPAPMFALKGKSKANKSQVPEALVRELQSLNALLLRERIFLAIHWTIFVGANLVGFFLASQCYAGFMGDEVTRFVMALTPLTFINAVALACLAPIRGTRREISRVKERMQYLKVQIDYGNLI